MGDILREGDPDTSGPKIIRPIPRRPFNLAFASPTPPEEDEDHSSPRPQISASDLRFLAPHQHAATPGSGSRDGSTPLSHTTSYLNLTAGALFGIYSPSTLGSFTKDEDDQDQDQERNGGTDTPIDAPVPRPGLDDATYELMRSRSSHQPPRRDSLFSPTTTATTPSSYRAPRKREVALQLMLRAALLFVLGVGYGVLVTRLPQNSHHHQHASHRLAAAYESHYEWRYLAFWGAAGVALGSLLPWFDRFWESKTTALSSSGSGSKSSLPLPNEEEEEEAAIGAPLIEKPTSASPPQADWALVVRGIGAFVGIVFAIRKLPWASTMQVSLTLALANPFLWYLIDRSKPGFLLSAAVGVAGSAVLMGLNPDVMPAPAAAGSGAAGAGAALYGWGAGGRFGGNATAAAAAASGGGNGGGQEVFGGLASQETIETSIWMLSVLFCSCVCFGNIGRRLALNSSAAGRGRWGGVR